MDDGAAGLTTPAASTKGCLTLKMDSKAAAMLVIGLPSSTPTGFHMPETRLHNTLLDAGAGGKVRPVSNGSVGRGADVQVWKASDGGIKHIQLPPDK